MITAAEHQRYLAYHAQVDLLIAEFITEAKPYFTKTTLKDWMEWSYQRTQQPVNATAESSVEILPATTATAVETWGVAEAANREAPMVTHVGGRDMQVCVLADWSDDQVLAFAERKHPCGTEYGWHIRREGDPTLAGNPERNPCTGDRGAAFVHIMLDA